MRDKDVSVTAIPSRNYAVAEGNSVKGQRFVEMRFGRSLKQKVKAEQLNEFLAAMRDAGVSFVFCKDKRE